MGLRIARRLAPALLAIIAAVSLVAAGRHEGALETALYLLAAIAIGGIVGMDRTED